jgi:inhibitor of KinA sporulation pathway (predicted exonuclease)
VIAVFDLEFTAWEGSMARGWSGPGERREIVQIGAVLLDGGLAEAAAFERLVRPRLNPVLSDYFVALTGITNERLAAEGVAFDEALAEFARFAGGAVLASNGDDHGVIAENCRLHGLPYPFAGRCADVSAALSAAADRDGHVTSCLLGEAFGFPADGRAHQALADARAVAEAIRRSGWRP